ncbi:MAG TPA: VanZ family protein [Moraxellaceae bacterium]
MPATLRTLLRAAFVICLAAVLYLALDPRPVFAGTDSDKVNHVIAFFTLAVLLRLGWPQYRIVLALLGLVGLGALIEVLQYFIGRDAAFGDLLADALGLLLGTAATMIFRLHPPASLGPD